VTRCAIGEIGTTFSLNTYTDCSVIAGGLGDSQTRPSKLFSSTTMPSSPGYRIDSFHGSGTSGEVWLAAVD
jgi:hypothetical protein